MKHIYNKFNTCFLVALLIFSTSCENNDSIARTGKPDITIAVTDQTVNEGESAVFDFNVAYAVNEPISIRIEVLDAEGNPIPTAEPIGDQNSGNGFSPIILDDISIPYNTWFDSGFFSYGYLGGTGYIVQVPAYTETFSISIDALLDAVSNEPPETYTFRLSGTSTMAAKIDEEISITINNINACIWTLETNDEFGDGWNGGSITATINGVSTSYAAAGFGSTFEIGMVDNDQYTFTYVAAAGGGGGPGWEEENTYTLTAPDGTVFADGPIPTAGEITSGTNICN